MNPKIQKGTTLGPLGMYTTAKPQTLFLCCSTAEDSIAKPRKDARNAGALQQGGDPEPREVSNGPGHGPLREKGRENALNPYAGFVGSRLWVPGLNRLQRSSQTLSPFNESYL